MTQPNKLAPREPLDFDKVDRACEQLVFDWLQWAHDFDEDRAQLALTMIAKRKAAYLELQRERDELIDNESKMNGALSAKQEIIETLKEENAQLKARVYKRGKLLSECLAAIDILAIRLRKHEPKTHLSKGVLEFIGELKQELAADDKGE